MGMGIDVQPWWYPLVLGIFFLGVGVYIFERTHVKANRILAVVMGLAGALFTVFGLFIAHSHFRGR
jgi:hypothetical protein